MDKVYYAIARGYTDDEGSIDYAIENDRGKVQEALTHYKTIERAEINISSGKFPTSRYSLVEVKPETGRQHQIRKHLSHIFHPIVGDRPHGCNKQNRFFLEHFNMGSMMLHAASISFEHPVSKETTCAFFAMGSESDMAGDTLGCRLYHAGAAQTDPQAHCTHAGPGGNGQCGANCDGFCTIATGACAADWPEVATCLTTCATFGDAEPFDAGDVSGDTLACRLYHLAVATMILDDHCPHTLPASETCI